VQQAARRAPSGTMAMSERPPTLELTVKSRLRVADHGEVFSPSWLVEDMLDLVKDESERIESRFLEPACGPGNFLVTVLRRKLVTVTKNYGRSDFERRHHALLALMSIYGIELLEDNGDECRRNLLELFADYVDATEGDTWHRAARNVLAVNIVRGNALDMTDFRKQPLVFAEWALPVPGRYQRRDFRYQSLATRASLIPGAPRAHLHESLVPIREYPLQTVHELADG